MLKQGLEVLKIFKGHAERTSLLDDFAYYENRQRVMHDERNRLPYRSFLSPVPVVPRPDFSDRTKKSSMDAFKIPSVTSSSETKEVPLKSDGNEETNVKEGIKEDTTTLIQKKMTSLTVSPTDDDSNPTTGSRLNQSPPKSKAAPSVSDQKTDPPEVVVDSLLSEDSDTVKVGSMPIKVTGSPPIVTVGTIPLDPSSLQKK